MGAETRGGAFAAFHEIHIDGQFIMRRFGVSRLLCSQYNPFVDVWNVRRGRDVPDRELQSFPRKRSLELC